MCTIHMPAAQESQKRGLDPLELELQMSVSHYVDAEPPTCVLQYSKSLVHLSGPFLPYILAF